VLALQWGQGLGLEVTGLYGDKTLRIEFTNNSIYDPCSMKLLMLVGMKDTTMVGKGTY